MWDVKDSEHNSYLHLYLLQENDDLEGVEFFLENGTTLTRNNSGQSPLHFAARYSPLILQLTDLLVKYGASVAEIDNQGCSVLHEVLKNSSVTLEAIKELLQLGAHPDFCDNTGKPPLAYCECSNLQPEEKIRAEKLIIQYSVAKKIDRMNLQESSDFSEISGDSVLCFNFLQGNRKVKEWADFRDSCIQEIIEMNNVKVRDEFTLFDFLNRVLEQSHDLNNDELKVILDELRENEYQSFRETLLSALEEYDFEFFIEYILWLAETSNSPKNRILSLRSNCIEKICSFLSKRELINLSLA